MLRWRKDAIEESRQLEVAAKAAQLAARLDPANEARHAEASTLFLLESQHLRREACWWRRLFRRYA